jgi:hypothetical protein
MGGVMYSKYRRGVPNRGAEADPGTCVPADAPAVITRGLELVDCEELHMRAVLESWRFKDMFWTPIMPWETCAH